MAAHRPATVRSVTKAVRIDCTPKVAFDFLADISNWPRWAVVNVLSAHRTADPEWWDMVTPHGPSRLRLRADPRHGVLDHDFEDPTASWSVPARVVANGAGAEFIITFFQPPAFSDEVFDEQVALIDVELDRLKQVLESADAFSPGGASSGRP